MRCVHRLRSAAWRVAVARTTAALTSCHAVTAWWQPRTCAGPETKTMDCWQGSGYRASLVLCKPGAGHATRVGRAACPRWRLSLQHAGCGAQKASLKHPLDVTYMG